MAILTCPCEGTPGATVTVSNVGASPNFAGAQASMTVSATHAAQGSTSLTAATDQYAWWASTASKVLARSYVWVPSAPASEKPLLQLRHAGGLAAQVVINVAGYARLSTAGSGTTQARATDTNPFPTGQWVRVELYADAGTSTTTGAARAAIYAGDSTTPLWDSGLISGIDVAGTNAAFTTQRFQVLAGTWTDSMGLKDGGDAVWGAWSANLPPTLTLPAPQAVNAATPVSLTAVATDDDAIASYAWTVVTAASTTTPTLTGASTATVTVAGFAAGHRVTLQCVVTDTGGLTATATTEVYTTVTATGTALAGDGVGASGWSIIGGAASQGAALADGSSTTRVESPDIGASPSQRGWPLQALSQRSALRVTLSDVVLTASATHSTRVRLYKGAALITERATSTLRKTADGTVSDLTTSDQSLYFDLTPSEITALGAGPWVGLRLDLVVED